MAELEGHWITMHGARVFINSKGDVIMGLKNKPDYIINAETEPDFNKWVGENKDELKKDGNFNPTKAEELFYKAKLTKNINFKSINQEEAIKTIRDNISENILDGWFREANSEYKPKLEQLILNNDELRNAGLNIAWRNYQDISGNKIDFNKFLDKPIKVYRGKNSENFTKSDVFMSYTFDKKVAESFGKNIEEISITPRETLGSYQTTGEAEILIKINRRK